MANTLELKWHGPLGEIIANRVSDWLEEQFPELSMMGLESTTENTGALVAQFPGNATKGDAEAVMNRPTPTVQALIKAVLDCPHDIVAERIILKRDLTIDISYSAHNAAGQLTERIKKALKHAAEEQAHAD